MNHDPITDMLRLADVESVVSGGFQVGGDWAVRFPAPDKMKFFAMVRGECWLSVEDEPAPVRMHAGDVILLIAGKRFVLASDPALEPLEYSAALVANGGPIAALNDRDDDLLVGGHIRLHPAYAPLLVDALPSFIHVHGASPEAGVIRWLLDRMVAEQSGDRPGAGLATTQLAYLLFLHILRAYLAMGEVPRTGWLRAATDPRLADVLRRVHAEPGKSWRLDEMARLSAMSRTAFAAHFKCVAGVAPLTYIAQWRMRLACHALRRGEQPVSVLARDLGYASESAFSHAFKRIVGVAPSHYLAA
ncbi:MAG: RCS-specific HTH-type transcriptional activator RclR [Luteibacter sp.]|uniref:AraC family transcriptional regulator n=1 Tax=Luteibacter sp. TaxID=1886636 RepID=UPI001386067F|nr:AraC family transcriptional regulator [Luteibacter sp.]KAF1004143.1 MAG: RCS-specific HTH-type transcriptional activator RclR [Luteibacter sp.]